MPAARDVAKEDAAFARHLRTAPLALKLNPDHDPATGRFTHGGGANVRPTHG